MSHQLKRFLAAATLAVFAGHVIASPAAEALAAYFGTPKWVRNSAQLQVPTVAKTNPPAARALERSLNYMKDSEVIQLSAAVFDGHMQASDLNEFSAFMATPVGKRVGEAFRSTATPAELEKAFEVLPKADAPAVNKLFGSPAGARALAALNSQDWYQTWSGYGETLMCRYFANEEPERFAILKQQAKCGAVQP